MRVPAFVFAVAVASVAPLAVAIPVQIQVTFENLAPQNSLAFAPLRFGFSNGTFDAFNVGSAGFLLGFPSIADAPIVTVAEGGSGSTWFPAFAAAEPNANTGSLTGPTGGPFVPGASNSAIFNVDTANPFFTFASMVVPSNDQFIGNDDPDEYRIFDDAGNLILTSIVQLNREIWDSGSELDIPANAAFLVNGINDQRVNENGVVLFDSDLSVFNGLQTAAGYNFNSSLLTANRPIGRISFAVIPEPAAGLTLLPAAILLMSRRRAR